MPFKEFLANIVRSARQFLVVKKIGANDLKRNFDGDDSIQMMSWFLDFEITCAYECFEVIIARELDDFGPNLQSDLLNFQILKCLAVIDWL